MGMKRRPKKTLAAQMRTETKRILREEKKAREGTEEEEAALEAEAKQEAAKIGQVMYEKCIEAMRAAARDKKQSVSVEALSVDSNFESYDLPRYKKAEARAERHNYAADHAVALLVADGSLKAKWNIETSEYKPRGSDPIFERSFTTYSIQIHISW